MATQDHGHQRVRVASDMHHDSPIILHDGTAQRALLEEGGVTLGRMRVKC